MVALTLDQVLPPSQTTSTSTLSFIFFIFFLLFVIVVVCLFVCLFVYLFIRLFVFGRGERGEDLIILYKIHSRHHIKISTHLFCVCHIPPPLRFFTPLSDYFIVGEKKGRKMMKEGGERGKREERRREGEKGRRRKEPGCLSRARRAALEGST